MSALRVNCANVGTIYDGRARGDCGRRGVLKWLERDRYYRWCTYAFIPLQYAGLGLACWLTSAA